MGHAQKLSGTKVLMSPPLFFWTKDVINKYAQIHVAPHHIQRVTQDAFQIVQGYPLKYYLLAQANFFLFEFIIPLLFGHFSRFSRLSDTQALHIILTFQNTAFLPLRVLVSLIKIPVLLSLRPEVFKEVQI